MAKQRYTQFFRNASVQYYADYQTAVAAIKSTFKNNKSSLKDGEFILGRYGFPGSGTTPSEGKEITHGVVVGVARRSGNDVYLDFLADENYVQFAISNGLAGFDLAATTVGTLNTSESSSTLTLYNVSQENGQVSVGTTSNTLDVVMAGQYNASNNRVALESTVTNAIGSITSSEMILGKSADGKTYTFGTLITQNNGVNDVTGSESLIFKTAPTSINPIITESDLSGVVGAMVYKGTVDSQHPLPTQDVQPGWTYVVAENGTYAGVACEVGDMIIAKDNTPAWNVVNGENQYEFTDVTVAVGGGLTTIGTIDGAALKIAVTDDYATLVGTADADNVQSPTVATGQINVLSRVEETNGVISAVTAYTLSTVASTGAAGDVSVADTNSVFTGTNVEDVLYELSNAITSSNLTIDGHKGAITSDTNTMVPVAADNGKIGVKTDNVYIGSGSSGITLLHVDTDGSSNTGSDLATVNTVTTHINALDVGTAVQAAIQAPQSDKPGVISTLVIYGEGETDGKIGLDDTTTVTNILMDGQYDAAKNRVQTEKSVQRIISTEIGQLDGTVDASLISTAITPSGQIDVLTAVEEVDGILTTGTKVTLSTVAHTGNASDVSFGTTAMNATNVQTAIEELLGNIKGSETTINSLNGNFTIGSGMLDVDDDDRVIGLHINPAYLQFGEDKSLDLAHVDVNGSSTIGTDLATLNTVTAHINALDGAVDASLISTAITPSGQIDVLTAVEQVDGILTTGTKVTLSTVAHSGAAADVTVEQSQSGFAASDVQGVLDELAVRIGSVAGNDIQAGDGIAISSSTTDGVKTYEVAVELGSASVVGTTAEYDNNAENLLVIATDGKLSISDTWDCGTY